MNTQYKQSKPTGPMAKALALSSATLLAFAASGHAQSAVNGSGGINMGSGFAEIYNMNASDLVSTTQGTQFETTWTDLSGNVVPVGQFTGIALDGSNVAFADLMPLTVQSLSVADSTNVANDVVTINQNGVDARVVTADTFNLLDQTSTDANGDPVSHAVTINNGVLQVDGDDLTEYPLIVDLPTVGGAHNMVPFRLSGDIFLDSRTS